MSDSKSDYSESSSNYVEKKVPSSEVDKGRYDRSKRREELHNEDWKKNPVNLNDIVEKYAPGATGKPKGVKFEFDGARYKVIADMASGYLRILDKRLKQYVTKNGKPSNSQKDTHFKILRREEM